jgi:hypothetical protein
LKTAGGEGVAPLADEPASKARDATTRLGSLLTPARLDWITGGIVLVVYAVVQIVLLQGPHPFDPAKYFRTAMDFPDVRADLWTLRIGLIAPVRVAIFLFGPSEAALYAVPLATGLTIAAAVYGMGLALFSDRVVAAAAALLTVLNANYLLNSSFIFPDTTATATFTAGLFCLVLGRTPWAERRAWRQNAACLSAGLLFGWTYLIREFSPVLLPAVVAAVVLLRYPLRRVALLVGATLAAVSLELLYGQLMYGQPLVHYELLRARGKTSVPAPQVLRFEHIQSQLQNPLDTLLVFPRLLLTWPAGWVFLLLVAVFLVALGLARRDRRLWMLAIWCFSFWAVMAVLGLVSTPSGRALINVTNIRYWYPIFPALVLGAFGGLSMAARRFLPAARGMLVTRSVTALLAGVALVPGLVQFDRCAAKDVWRNEPEARWDEVRVWFSTPEAKPYRFVLTDKDTVRVLPVYIRTTFGSRVWDGRARRFGTGPRRMVPTTDLRASLILLHRDRLSTIPDARTELRALRQAWAPIFVGSDTKMVVLAYRPSPDQVVGADLAWWQVSRPTVPTAAGCGQSPYEPEG